MTDKTILYITAGEESGDLLGGEVLKRITTAVTGITFKGIGGMEMISAGLEPVFDSGKLGFMGFFELLRHVSVIKRALKTVFESICRDKPPVVLMIDFSEFHIKLAKKIKKALPNTRIIKYVSPQVWASREDRIKDIVEYYDCLCCIFPFETAIYKNEPIDCRYVGHPLIDKFELLLNHSEFYEKFRLDEGKTLISVFPGSRKQEIKKHLPVIKKFIVNALKKYKSIEFVICRSSNISEDIYRSYRLDKNVKIISSEYQWDVMKYSGIVLTKSGTSTLQTAITGTPSVVFYKVNPLSYFIAKKIVKSKFISLPNIIAGKQINPELIQSEFTPDNLLSETKKLLENEDVYKLRKKELELIKDSVGGKGAALNVAAAVIEYLNLGN